MKRTALDRLPRHFELAERREHLKSVAATRNPSSLNHPLPNGDCSAGRFVHPLVHGLAQRMLPQLLLELGMLAP